jgi:hypothetical protein
MSDEEWVEVANGPDVATAQRNFSEWLKSVGKTQEDLDPLQVRMDTIRGDFTDRRRLMVRKEVLDDLPEM